MNRKKRLTKKREKIKNRNRKKTVLKDIQRGEITKDYRWYPIDRKWQEIFYEFLRDAGFDEYGYYVGDKGTYKTDKGGFENKVFLLNPYDWSFDYENTQVEAPPNFIFKKENIRIEWYKYPLRSSYSNKEITEDKLKSILEECLKSIKGE